MHEPGRSQRVLIIDFGSQVTQLIARRVRESGVYCEIVPYDKASEALSSFAPRAVILSGGPASAVGDDMPRAPAELYAASLPVLGICYGEQTMCADLGGSVEVDEQREFGRAIVEVVERCALFDGVWAPGERHQVWMSHGDRVVALPAGFRVVAMSENAPFAAIADEQRGFYGVQFHPEVVHTPDGAALLRNFTHRIAGCTGEWSMAAFREIAIARVRETVGQGRVICGLSGGVDSAVAAMLLFEAIGEQLVCVFVDTGLLRAGEADEVVSVFRDRFNIPLVHRDAGELFLERLAGISDPEEKRTIIGATFVDLRGRG